MKSIKTAKQNDNVSAKAWEDKIHVIRPFLEQRQGYDQLCSEIAYILRKRIEAREIEYSSITCRAKTLSSFLEKLNRKPYKNPLTDITDFAGVRVVFLYQSDRPAIEEIIEDEFTVLEKIDKVEEQDVDRFGYGALHYLVNLGQKSSGARYDDLKNLVCEIQVRTVLQDAWAIIDHHLVYKQESAIPKHLRRQLNSLSGLFSTADDQFDTLRQKRLEYIKQIQAGRDGSDNFANLEFNLDTYAEFLKNYFADLDLISDDDGSRLSFSILTKYGYESFDKLTHLLRRTKKARDQYLPPVSGDSAALEVFKALGLVEPSFRQDYLDPPHSDDLEKHIEAVED